MEPSRRKPPFQHGPLHSTKPLRLLETSSTSRQLFDWSKGGHDLNSLDELGRTPLSIAAYRGRVDVVELLIKNGVNVSASGGGETALHSAARLCRLGSARALLAADGARVLADAMDEWGRSPLHIASEEGGHVAALARRCLALVRLLVEEHGAKVNARDHSDRTPLHGASRGHLVDVMHTLLIAGAELEARNHMGRTPLHVASYSFLGGNINDTAATAVRVLVKAGARINSQDNQGISPLQMATYGERLKVVEILIAAGAKLDQKDRHGNTSLHTATRHKEIAILNTLLEAGADVNARNNDRKTPLDSAKRRGNAAAADALQAAGGRHGADNID